MQTGSTAQITLSASTTLLAQGLAAAGRMVHTFASGATAAMSKLSLAHGSAPKGQSWATHAVGQVAGSMAMRGIDLMVDQGKKVFDFNEQLTRFGIAARKSGKDLADVGVAARAASDATGIDANEVVRGTRAYVDMAGAQAYSAEKLTLLAEVSQATKADIGDLTQVVFQLQHAMKISDADLKESLGGVINMSKDGAVHFSQMAQEIAELAPQAARYGMVGREGINQLTAMMQVARTGFGTVSEMGTGITRVFSGLTLHASKFRQYGVEVFNVGKDGTKTWRKFSDIFRDIRTNNILAKDPELLRKAFGRSEADRTIRLWMEGTEELRKLEEAGKANGVVQQDLATYTTSAAGRMEISFAKMHNAFAEALTPERVDQIVGGMQRIAQSIGPISAAAGRAFDAFGRLAHLVARVKGRIGGGSTYERGGGMSDEEQALIGALRLEAQGKRVYWEPGARERALRVQEHAKNYDAAMQEIMGAEDDFGATDESIKRAIRASSGNRGTEVGRQQSEAGRAYLIDRDQEISTERYKRLKAEVNAEQEAQRKDMAPYQSTYDAGRAATEKFQEQQKANAEAMRQIAMDAAKHLADIIVNGMHAKPTNVVVDGNTIARAGNSATDQRRR